MKLSQFKFKLPEEQIALYPPHRKFENEDGTIDRVYNRDQCKLMVVHRKSEKIDIFKKDAEGNDTTEPMTFRNLLDYFNEGDTFIFNDTKVFPARLYGTKEKTDAQIEVFLLRELNEELRLWDVLVEPARKIRIGNKLFFDGEGPMVAEVIDNTTSTTVLTMSSSASYSRLAKPHCPAISLTAARPSPTIWSSSRPSLPRMKVPSLPPLPVFISVVS